MFQSVTKFRTLRMGKKARGVTIGERGKEAMFIVPRPKQVVEVNFWVLRHKIRQGILASLAVGFGAVAALLGWQFVIGLAILVFIIGFVTGGDVEVSP